MAANSFREDEHINNSDKKKIFVRIIRYLRPHIKEIIPVIISLMITVGIGLVSPLLIEYAIDVHVADKNMRGLIIVASSVALLGLVYMLFVKLRMYMMNKVANKILLDIREELYEHIQKLSFTFFDSRPTGKILARIIGDVNSLKDVMANTITNLIPNFITVFGVVFIMLVKDWKLALGTLCSMPLMIIAIFWIRSMTHTRWADMRKKASNLNAYVHEDIAGIAVVQSFHAEDETRSTFEDLANKHRDSYISACRAADLFGPAIDMSWAVSSMMLYLVAVRLLGYTEASVGLIAAFASYATMFWSPIMGLSNYYNQLVTNISAAERVFDILDTEPEIVDKEDAEELPDITGQVSFANVGFTYDEGTASEKKVLENVNFTAKPGETIALVGPTGAGKTTIVNLISRFYDIQKGKILVDGHDITGVKINSLRRQMGIMTQDNFIFSGTVRENIMYGNLSATEEEMIEAAKAVNAHDFIMKLENGYDTVLKERGAGLSIGQRQLIAFARTMISKPKILILDEATSNIDTHTELLVQKGIQTMLSGRTSFVIAHRLSTIKSADRIFVINDGGIAESGSHENLLRKHGAYYDLYMAQFA
ncbi:ATP-binding cassette, subfamily B [Butyrivibrio fibrisolvens DSM 3071]|uniref:ATP-binding cassette, subfamily B n=1 Tax=Butyrivibrio fibrisolvens DSM 3071 TaxID=1121131 RepID=A0A1M5QEI8_BUTFI|nr:ABC transporter ATP-binding protein [Butyrivibrio fibrisolvens]SHH12585.1 ATP-binding cassette, subfamily B [Butyrivibrio fibrisolvens DSM 3071]